MGSIDWLCLPKFDSDACFAALLGFDEHGRWDIRPTVAVSNVEQRYDGDTLVLTTEMECEAGKVRIVDFMPPSRERSDLIRRIEGVAGEVPLQMVLAPRFGYGADRPFVRNGGAGMLSFTAGPDTLRLHASVPLSPSRDRVTAQLVVRAGERIDLQLAWHLSHESSPPPLDADTELRRTREYWSTWAGRCNYHGPYREAVMRSLLTLKALTYAPTGAIVAAPTASLPEELGGVRNWDYRFCWMRDATLTLRALMFGGYVDEAQAFRDWLVRTIAGDPTQTQIMYSIDGARRLTEMDLPWLPGYEGSRPVRIGNAASNQFQLDIYGEAIGALYQARRLGVPAASDAWPAAQVLIEHIMKVWQYPDDGIWEVRSGRKHFTYSKMMAWVAVDRSIRLIEEFGSGGQPGRTLLPSLRALRERIHEEVCERGFNPRIGAFTQSYGGEALDASVLLMPHVGFLPAGDPRVRGTVAAIEKNLLRDGFVLRYATEGEADGLAGSEGAFLACSFWLADNYAFAGRTDEAVALYDRLLALRNHLGLLAEEYEPRLSRQIGNFPQGFSHLALITTARVLQAASAPGPAEVSAAA
jgi:GH15 family glucan-1,4-alpha-glucosidase